MAASIVLVNAAMALNPAVLITAGIVALGVALVMAYKKFDTFRAVVNAVVNNIAGNFEFMANAFIKTINLLIKGINLIKPGKDIGTLAEVSFGRLGSDGGGDGGANPAGLDYKAMATGGIVRSPTFALIGEAGPEAVIPLSKMGSMGGGVTINVQGGDPNSVVDALRTYMRQNGSVPIKVSNVY
jgi:SLT domain-containing protein